MTGISIDFMAVLPPVAVPPAPMAEKAGFAALIAGMTAAYEMPADIADDMELPGLPLDRQDFAGGDAGPADDGLDDDSPIIVDVSFLLSGSTPVVPVVPAPVVGALSRLGFVRGEGPDVSLATARQQPAQAPVPADTVAQPSISDAAVTRQPAEDGAPTSRETHTAIDRSLPRPIEVSATDRAAISRIMANAANADGPQSPPAAVSTVQPAANPHAPPMIQTPIMPSPVQRPAPVRAVSSQVDVSRDASTELETAPSRPRDVSAPQTAAAIVAPSPAVVPMPASVIAVAPVDNKPLPAGIGAEAPAPAAMILPTAPAAPLPVRETVIGDRPHGIDTDRADWIETLVDRIDEARSRGHGRITQLRLLPDALGAVDVRIEQNGDRVNVHFTADNAQARALLADATARLGDLADARGLRLGDTGVQQGPGGQRHTGRDQQQDANPANHAPIATESDAPADDTADRLA